MVKQLGTKIVTPREARYGTSGVVVSGPNALSGVGFGTGGALSALDYGGGGRGGSSLPLSDDWLRARAEEAAANQRLIAASQAKAAEDAINSGKTSAVPTQTTKPTAPPISTGIQSDYKSSFSSGTQSLNMNKDVGSLFFEPTIYEKQTGSFTAPGGREVPITEIFSFDPKGMSLGGGAFVSTELPATKEEFDFFRSQTNVLEASSDKRGTISKIKETPIITTFGTGYTNLDKSLKQTTDITIGSLYKALDYDPKDPRLGVTTDFLINENLLPPATAYIGEFAAGAGLNILEDVRTKPMKSVILGSVGLGAGFAFSGLSSGAAAISPTLGSVVNIGGLGAGGVLTGLYAKEIAGDLLNVKSFGEAGGVLGVAGKDISLMGLGFGKGSQLFGKFEGFLATRGRTFIDIPQGIYPSAPLNKQLRMFRKNIYKELGDMPGAFHTTGSKFWRGTIEDFNVGTSELPGLYGSTEISTPFARISGSGKYKLIPSIRDILTPPGKPGVAFLQPTEFRYSPTYKGINFIEGQKFKYKWKLPAKSGYADVPLIKGEIEAIFRPGTGEYGLTNRGFYTRINDVRVPIDSFQYKGELVKSGKTYNPLTGKTSSGSSYKLPPSSYPIYSPSSLGLSSLFSLRSKGSSSLFKSSKVKSYIPPKRYSYLKPSSKSSYLSSYKSYLHPSSSRGYPPSSRGYSYSPPKFPTMKSPIVPYFPILGAPQSLSGIKLNRKFFRTLSLGTIIKKSYGLKTPKYSRKQEESGLFERSGKPTKWVPNIVISVKKFKKKLL